jgi:hypothetical protein
MELDSISPVVIIKFVAASWLREGSCNLVVKLDMTSRKQPNAGTHQRVISRIVNSFELGRDSSCENIRLCRSSEGCRGVHLRN